MSSREIQKALQESGLTIPAGGFDPSVTMTSCTWSCKDSCAAMCKESCAETQSGIQPKPIEPVPTQ